MTRTEELLNALKSLLKSRQIPYAQLARHLAVSESTVKRMLTTGKFNIDRLVEICRFLQVDAAEFLQTMLRQQQQVSQLSIEQERVVVSDEKLLLVTVCAYNHWTFEEILDTYALDEAELIKLLLQLERIHFLELLPDNRIRLKVSQHFKWHKNGPIQRYFNSQIQSDFMRSEFTANGELLLVVTGMLSRESNAAIQQAMHQLAGEFTALSSQDKRLKPLTHRFGSNLVMAMRPWELPAFAHLRRSENNKKF